MKSSKSNFGYNNICIENNDSEFHVATSQLTVKNAGFHGTSFFVFCLFVLVWLDLV